jgi:hypothetical protein
MMLPMADVPSRSRTRGAASSPTSPTRRTAGQRNTVVEPEGLWIPCGRRSAGFGAPGPVAPCAGQHGHRPVQGVRPAVPGAGHGHCQHDHHRGRHQADPGRPADLHRGGPCRAGAVLCAPPEAAGDCGDLHPQPCRPLWWRARRDRRGRRQGRAGAGDCTGWASWKKQ